MSEEKKTNTPETEEAKKTETIDADVTTDGNGNQKAVPHETFGQKAWNGLCAVGRFCKKAAPIVLAFGAGAGAATGAAFLLGGKEDNNAIDTTYQESNAVEQKDEGDQQ